MAPSPRAFVAFLLVISALGACGRPDPNGPEARAARLARGEHLVKHVIVCGGCHTPVNAKDEWVDSSFLAGREKKLPDGTYFAFSNITSDKETGIGNWSEQDIVNIMRYGRRPDGSLISPRMPIVLFRRLSDEDVAAVAAYIKTVPAIRNPIHRSATKMDQPPSGGYGPQISVPHPSTSNKIAYGKYLVDAAQCMDCHSPWSPDGVLMADRLGAGGWAFPSWATGKPLNISKNITPHREDGIGAWSDEQIIHAIRDGESPSGKLNNPMLSKYYKAMTDDEVKAIVAYLRTIPPRSGIGAE